MAEHHGEFVSYLRVSTARQGASRLGVEAQRKAVADFLNDGRWRLIGEYVEVESGAHDDRPKLAEALARCRLHNATLVIARMDRLSRNVNFLTELQKAGAKFVAADMPEANERVVQIMAAVAQAERRMISARTKAALAVARARGVKLGGDRGNLRGVAGHGSAASAASAAKRRQKAEQRAKDLAPTIAELRANGATSLRQIAEGLNARGIPAARGGRWGAAQVSRLGIAADD